MSIHEEVEYAQVMKANLARQKRQRFHYGYNVQLFSKDKVLYRKRCHEAFFGSGLDFRYYIENLRTFQLNNLFIPISEFKISSNNRNV